jgi:hypothetical protein
VYILEVLGMDGRVSKSAVENQTVKMWPG